MELHWTEGMLGPSITALGRVYLRGQHEGLPDVQIALAGDFGRSFLAEFEFESDARWWPKPLVAYPLETTDLHEAEDAALTLLRTLVAEAFRLTREYVHAIRLGAEHDSALVMDAYRIQSLERSLQQPVKIFRS